MEKKKKAKNKIKKIITRKCLICGRKMRIKVFANCKYDKVYYYGIIKFPVKGSGEYAKTGKFRYCGKMHNVIKWTGKEKEVEYWECDKCYHEGQAEI